MKILSRIFYAKNKAWENSKTVHAAVSNFLSFQSDGPLLVTIKKYVEPRTGNQNRYYWMLVEILAGELGYESKDACHSMLMQECGFGEYIKYKGREYFDRKSSATLDKEQFAKLIEKCFEVAAFLNEGRDPESMLNLPKAGEYENHNS